jgi:HPt (histidine-containing phosphotransfer) domain-containing protein
MPAEQVESALHFLKGSALNLGFSLLAQLCQDGEKVASAGNGAQVDLINVATAYELSKTAFQDGLSGIRAA